MSNNQAIAEVERLREFWTIDEENDDNFFFESHTLVEEAKRLFHWEKF